MYRNKLILRSRIHRIGWSMALISIAITMSGCGVLSHIAIPFDVSEFNEFSLTFSGVFGICPEEGGVAEAHITRNDDGEFLLELGIAFYNEFGEAEIRPEPVRTLTDEEFDRMRGVFSRVFIHPLLNGACLILPLDPCLVGHYQWDSVEASGFVCSYPRVAEQSEARILGFLESLKAE